MPPIVPPVPPRLVTRLAAPPAAAGPDVEDAVSPARFATYLLYAQQVRSRAWAAYAWNARVSGALLQVLVHAEVALRNAVNRAMTAAFGAAWPYAQAFEITLGTGRGEYNAARGRLEQRLGRRPLSTGDFVAGQTMVFWEALLVRRYKGRVWDRQFATAFPGAAAGETYRDVHDAVEPLRRVRNRIAHHEPLLAENVTDVYARALAVTHWASPAKAAWVAAEWPPLDDYNGPP